MRRRARRAITFIAIAAVASFLLPATPADAAPLVVSSDPYVNPSSQHKTEVEPDTFAFGSTIVSTFQVGRFFDGGSSNIGWATSVNGGASWSNGFLPGLTTLSVPAGPYDRASDPAVAYDAKHGAWLINTLPLSDPGPRGVAVAVNRSSDGLTWGNSIVVASAGGGSYDKNWIVCDNNAGSPFFGNCYVTWDDSGVGNRLLASSSSDGGLTWGPPRTTANNASGLGGQPVVQPNGTVVVPSGSGSLTSIIVYRSTTGGASWTAPQTITGVSHHNEAGGLRAPALPSAEIDKAGRVYVVWADCRFRAGCSSNDIVMTRSNDGITWSPVKRIPIDLKTSTVDHFIPGLAVNPTTRAGTAALTLTYYWYPQTSCNTSTCDLNVSYVSSSDSGKTWSAPVQINTTPMKLAWIADTSQGRMVGDYVSTSYVGASPITVVAIATAKDATFHEDMYAATLTASATGPVRAAEDDAVLFAGSQATGPAQTFN